MNRNTLYLIILVFFALKAFGLNGKSVEELKLLVAEQVNDSTKINFKKDLSYAY